jgi:phenylpropionate dioxygenase-like ring-hydroxylating dioxygenase large terminal subunit
VAQHLPVLYETPRAADAVLVPPQTKGRASVVRLEKAWFIACMSRELRHKPIARTIQGVPLVLFRDQAGVAGTLLDRCPHRNVPLSLGEVASDGNLQCAYHGWRFDRAGTCRAIPSYIGEPDGKGRRALSYPTIEQQGFVWVYATPGDMPESRPHKFEYADARGYTTVRQVVQARASMYSTIENALDVPHTAYLHRGLFRSESRGIEITAKVRRTPDRVEAEYIGEPRPPGLIAKILSPSGGMVTHFDRFLLPCVAQVEYRIGTENHLLVDSVMTPVEDFLTTIYAVVSFKMRLPGWLVRPFVKPLALRVFKQDAYILENQTRLIREFGGEQFVSTDIDVLGRHIWRLLKQAERGDAGGEEEGEVKLVV